MRVIGNSRCAVGAFTVWLLASAVADAQTPAGHQHHEHGGQEAKQPAALPPRVFLDKNPRIVWFQLNRLTNDRLLQVERATTDLKYGPVYTAILTRAGMPRQHRHEALQSLVKLNQSDEVVELLQALSGLDDAKKEDRSVGQQLAAMLMAQSTAQLRRKSADLNAATAAENAISRRAAFAGLVTAGERLTAVQLAEKSPAATVDFLSAVRMVPDGAQRGELRTAVVARLDAANGVPVRRAALLALAHVPSQVGDNFRISAEHIRQTPLRAAAVATMLAIPAKERGAESAADVVDALVKHAEETPAAERTSDAFVDAMQLVDQLLALVPAEQARKYRERLRAVVVRVIRLRTVEEEMRYDTPYFAVEAGRPVQIVLQNEDLMPHNLVVTAPGALREVAELGAAAGPEGGVPGKQYVPVSDKVLFATAMVPAHSQERLTFTAPSEPGEYPYVCTFPRHWMRMYGVMVVVKDLDAWQKNPQKPVDPIGNTREFVKSWQMSDFADLATANWEGRSAEIGAKIFTEATCAQCHKLRGQGGAVGPDLTDVMQRWKGDRAGILREILDPSHRIEPKYAVQIVYLNNGKVVSGIVKSEDKETLAIVSNPEEPAPQVIDRDDIDEVVRSPKSMMPKALLDRFNRDEILELLAYVTGQPGAAGGQ